MLQVFRCCGGEGGRERLKVPLKVTYMLVWVFMGGTCPIDPLNILRVSPLHKAVCVEAVPTAARRGCGGGVPLVAVAAREERRTKLGHAPLHRQPPPLLPPPPTAAGTAVSLRPSSSLSHAPAAAAGSASLGYVRQFVRTLPNGTFIWKTATQGTCLLSQ